MEAYEVKFKLVCEQSLMVKAENQKDAKTKASQILSNTDAHNKISGSIITKTTILDAKPKKRYAWVNFEDYNINGIGGRYDSGENGRTNQVRPWRQAPGSRKAERHRQAYWQEDAVNEIDGLRIQKS